MMETIACHLQISRSSVSRLLAHAREVGLVRISVFTSPGLRDILAGQIANLFGVQISVVPIHDVHAEVDRLRSAALVATKHLIGTFFPGVTPDIAQENTIAEVTRVMPHVSFAGFTIAQLNGAAIATESGVPYIEAIIARTAKAIGGYIVNFPVSAFFDYVGIGEALWRERPVQPVLNTIDSTDVALLGVGSMLTYLPSHVYSGDFLSPSKIVTAQNDGTVGDVHTTLIRGDGPTSIHLNGRASGPNSATSKKTLRHLYVVSGASKALPLPGALRVGVATDLILGGGAACKLLDLVHAHMTSRRSYI